MTVTEEITEAVVWEGRISEMGPLDSSTHPDLRIPDDFLATVRKKDDDPLFVTVEVEAGFSASKRKWKMEHLNKVIEKVNKERMTGYLGHPLLKKEEYETSYPLPQVVWVAARAVNSNTAAFKGYVLKRAEARTDLELGIIDGVSIFGDSRMKPIQGGYEVLDFTPETIDFARKGRSGMTSRVVSLTGEQAPKGGNVEPKDIAALSPDEIKTHAPLVFAAIQSEASAPLTTKVGEMEGVINGMKPEVDLLEEIKKLLKLADGESPVEKLSNLLQKVEEAASSGVRDFIKEVVAKKVKTERGQAIVHRLLGEMHSEYEGQTLDDALKTKIADDVEKRMDEDEHIKGLVGEMAPFNDERGHTDTGGTRLGGRSRAGAERGRGNADEGVVRETGNIRVRKVKVS